MPSGAGGVGGAPVVAGLHGASCWLGYGPAQRRPRDAVARDRPHRPRWWRGNGGVVSIDPQHLDDEALKQEMENALAGVDGDALLGRAAPSHEAGGEERGRIRGRIVSIRGAEVFVDYGGKAEGFIPLDEFESDQPPQVGQVYEFIPHGFDRDSGQMRLSLRDVKHDVDWSTLQVGDVIEGRVTGTNIGGLELQLHGVRAFMPKSQVDVVRHEDFRPFVGKRLECEITEIDRRGKNVLVSRRRVLEKRLAEERAALREQLEAGQVRAGTVRRLADFGAFVDIGGIEGLLHISDMSHARVQHPKDVVKVGQELQVKILKIDPERNRISLGIKQLAPDPWELVEANYRAGGTVEGRVTRLMDFGAFVELEPGIEGLIPISELSWGQRVRHPRDVVNEGDHVRVVVLGVEGAKRRISLSLKALTSDPWHDIAARYPVNAVISGAVMRLAAFGAFIQLEEGVEGLVHISELSHERVRSVGDVVKEGEVVQCRVLGVDPEQRRISLSIKAVTESAAPAADTVAEPPPPRKERKRPLRGGLSW